MTQFNPHYESGMPVVLVPSWLMRLTPKDALFRARVLGRRGTRRHCPGPRDRLPQRPPHSNANATVWNHTGGDTAVQPVWTAAEHTPPTRGRIAAPHPNPAAHPKPCG